MLKHSRMMSKGFPFPFLELVTAIADSPTGVFMVSRLMSWYMTLNCYVNASGQLSVLMECALPFTFLHLYIYLFLLYCLYNKSSIKTIVIKKHSGTVAVYIFLRHDLITTVPSDLSAPLILLLNILKC